MAFPIPYPNSEKEVMLNRCGCLQEADISKCIANTASSFPPSSVVQSALSAAPPRRRQDPESIAASVQTPSPMPKERIAQLNHRRRAPESNSWSQPMIQTLWPPKILKGYELSNPSPYTEGKPIKSGWSVGSSHYFRELAVGGWPVRFTLPVMTCSTRLFLVVADYV
ncbi:uncharacterized protein N7518_010209 [Penicillium psychrosexuale]|uniref:uncharacterized protein n=1 Tax=Penicillium psychrosexuale TaxID=1002107 RepID=UPI0025453C78|nr:uncharacterized protein N7518_010209 [Penicillium psychrosexuale]KAJ5781726.1 hypothetical protein N7518_010209 [Penicillium psychrosexuale]